MKKKYKQITWTALALLILIVLSIRVYYENSNQELIGGQRDEHGCLIPAGYSYNETLGVCLREWEITGLNRRILEQATFDYKPYGITVDSIVLDETCAECYKIWLDTLGKKRSVGITLASSRYYCPSERNPNTYCIAVYDPVCGVDSIGDMNTFSNNCFACLNSSIEYYFNGECP